MMAKRLGSRYLPGKRSHDWVKVKTHGRQEFVICGYTRGQGRRVGGFGALVLGVRRGGELRLRRQLRDRVHRPRRSTDAQGEAEAAGARRRRRSPRCRACRRCGRATSSGSSRSSSARSSSPSGRTTAGCGRRRSRACARTRSRTRCAARSRCPTEIRRGKRVLRLSNLDKPFWPDEGITKGDLLAYYRDVAPVLVPHLKDRPFTMKRFPDGWQGKHFFQKDAPKHMPDWIKRVPYLATSRETREKRTIDYPLVNDELALLWMVNMGCIDLNTWYSRIDRPDRPGLGALRPRPVGRRRASRRRCRWRGS